MSSITLNGVSKEFRRPDGTTLHVLDRVSFEAREGSFSSVVGPSGCGKSTILSLIAGLDRPTSGDILVGGEPLERAIPRIGFVFQRPRLLQWRRVGNNVLLPLEKESGREDKVARVGRYLKLVGLEGYEDYYPAQLSGGMQQRVAIARALAIEPDILLMDEPFSGLDEITARKMREELLRIWKETGKTVVFVTHSIGEAVFLSEQVLMISPKPATVEKAATINLPYPRRYGDPAMFEIETRLMREFLEMGTDDDLKFQPL
jgi:NitT/TauT family transport system ATP-binding protein